MIAMGQLALPEAILLASLILAGTGVVVAVILRNRRVPPSPALRGSQLEFPHSAVGRPVEPSEIPVGLDYPLEVGSRVLAYSQGRWWRATVIGLEPEDRVRVHFPGWDDKWDVVVPRDELQVDLNAGGDSAASG
jgi:hypothetical protein